jgi:hypothetical protein
MRTLATVLLCGAAFALIFAAGFAVTYDWNAYADLKAQRQARGSDYTLGEVLGGAVRSIREDPWP